MKKPETAFLHDAILAVFAPLLLVMVVAFVSIPYTLGAHLGDERHSFTHFHPT